jgi:hypothetical protein
MSHTIYTAKFEQMIIHQHVHLRQKVFFQRTVPDEGYSRSVLCTLNLISKFLYYLNLFQYRKQLPSSFCAFKCQTENIFEISEIYKIAKMKAIFLKLYSNMTSFFRFAKKNRAIYRIVTNRRFISPSVINIRYS